MSRSGAIEVTEGSPVGNHAARPLIAATRDAALAQAVQQLARHIPVVVVADAAGLTDEILRHGSNLVILDAAAANGELPALVDALNRQFPDTRLMVAGQSAEQGQLASRIADESVFRFIHKPATAQRLQLFVEAATRESAWRGTPGSAAGRPRPPSRIAPVLAGLVAVVIAIAAAWIFWPEGVAARLNARDQAKVEEMLQQARQATAAGNYVSFNGTSSAELYQGVLDLDPVNELARAGLGNALDSAIRSARQSLVGGELDAATNQMEALRLIAPTHRGLGELASEVDAETARRLADATAREQMAERQRQIQDALDLMAGSIQAGSLLEPEEDSAIRHFQVAQDLSAGDPAVRSARNQLIASLVAAGDRSLQARQLPEARRFAAAASRINSNAAALRALTDRIEKATSVPAPKPAKATPTVAEVARTLEAVVPTTAVEAPDPAATTALPQPAAPEPEPKRVEAAWVPGEGVVGANQLTLVRAGDAEYPESAWAARISGWVELEFTVARNGSVKDAKVTASEPRRIFDNAAIRAVRGNRYEPVLKDGEAVEQRARIRMRYTYKE